MARVPAPRAEPRASALAPAPDLVAAPLPPPEPPPDQSADVEWLHEVDPFGETLERGDVGHVQGRIEGRLWARRRVWETATQDGFVLGVLKHGLRLPLLGGRWPPRHSATRNSVPAEADEWAREQVTRLLDMGAIKRWCNLIAELRAAGHCAGDRPHAVMPIIVASNGIGRGWRLIHDTRFINGFLERWKFKLERLADFVKMLRRGGATLER